MALLKSEHPLTHALLIQRLSVPLKLSIQNTDPNVMLIKNTSSGNNVLIKIGSLTMKSVTRQSKQEKSRGAT